eukprot:TRINITY_DN6634_c0_g1_i3.p1 TRINITY_DN6634_c0_g1~~TRINITY_DN6634_c0_g1_i3.p1  ORF type:complete len:277 (-),score=31.36 TRINITY_DN6634_c0_g1_i3:141-971(-)
MWTKHARDQIVRLKKAKKMSKGKVRQVRVPYLTSPYLNGFEETYREELLLSKDEMVIFENGSYAIVPNSLNNPLPKQKSETQNGETQEEDAEPEELQVEEIQSKSPTPINLEHTINMENNQRIRFIISVLFNKPDLEVIGLGMYKEKLMKDLQSRKVYDPTWCVNDQDLIEKEKYIEQVWDTTTTELQSDGKYSQTKATYNVEYDPKDEGNSEAGVTFWLPNHVSMTFVEDKANNTMSISTFSLDTRKNVQLGIETRINSEGDKLSTKFIRAVATK